MTSRLTLLLSLFSLHYSIFAGETGAIRPLAQNHVIVGVSPDPLKFPLYNPTILALPNGRLVAGYSLTGKNPPPGVSTGMHYLTSDDHGLTWQERAVVKMSQARLILANNILYSLGAGSPLTMIRSADNGSTWSEPASLVRGGERWHQSANNFIRANGNIYLVIERRYSNEITSWEVGEHSPIVMKANEKSNLRQAASWTYSNELPFINLIPGYRENNLALGPFGIPFYEQKFPGSNLIAPGRAAHPVGWLEANIAQIKDPSHPWYDPAGKTFHILLRANTNGTGYAALAKAVENSDGSITVSLQTSPSGRKIIFIPMPGGQMRYHITYDEKTKLYWLVSSQATDSLTRAETLPIERLSIPYNERHRLALHFSNDLLHWNFAGIVAIGGSPREARHYASMDIDGDDLVILSRSGDAQALSAHDGNLITFHRVKNFRNLVY